MISISPRLCLSTHIMPTHTGMPTIVSYGRALKVLGSGFKGSGLGLSFDVGRWAFDLPANAH